MVPPMALTSLSGKVAIVTGASRGLGRHIARALAGEGARVVAAARSRAELDEVVAELGRSGARALAVPADVARRADLEALVARAERELGGVDVLVNNAGIETVARFHELPLETMREMVEVNLLGALTLTRLVLPGMLARGAGHIVNISSLAGKAGPPLAETYAATKAALIGFTQSLRATYDGTGVSASAVCPGYVRGEGMFADRARVAQVTPPSLIGTSAPEDVAQAVLDAIREDRPEIIVSPGPKALLAAASQIFPRLPGWLIRRMKLRAMYEKQAGGE